MQLLWPLTEAGSINGLIGALVLLACLLHPQYPLNKSLWTGSFALLTSSISMPLLLGFDLLLGQRTPRLSLPLYWLGQNAILVYLGTSLVMWSDCVKSLFGSKLYLRL